MDRFRFLAPLVILAGLLLLVSFDSSSAQVKKGASRPMLTTHLMKGLVKPHCGSLKKGLDSGPSTAEEWEELAVHAALLNESSFILMADKRCPDRVWAEAATKALRKGSADCLKAIEAKDLEAAKSAFGAMTKSCGACHKAHKKKG